MTGLCINWESFLVRWVTWLRSTKLLQWLVKNPKNRIIVFLLLVLWSWTSRWPTGSCSVWEIKFAKIIFSFVDRRYSITNSWSSGVDLRPLQCPKFGLVPTSVKSVSRVKTLHYLQIYLNRPDPFVFMSVVVDTSGHIHGYVRGHGYQVIREKLHSS